MPNLGRKRRLASSDQWIVATISDRGCVIPGCDRPAHWCQLHHLTHWANGGGTNLDNLALVCEKHHHLIHDDHWNLRHLDDDTWHLTRPNRTTVTPPRYPGNQRPPPGAVNALAVGPTERPVVHDGHLQRGHLPLVS